MRYLKLLPLIAASVLLSGCGDLLSIEPLATATNSVLEPALQGNWAMEDSMLIVKSGENQSYDLRFIGDDGETIPLTCRLVRIGGKLIADVQSTHPGAFAIPAHAFLLVDPPGTSLDLRFIDSDWIQSQAQAAEAPAHVLVQNHPLITAPSASVRDFIARYGLRKEAWAEPIHFTRLK
jgi:hypothetical protein